MPHPSSGEYARRYRADPEKREVMNARSRAHYHKKMQDPIWRERERARGREKNKRLPSHQRKLYRYGISPAEYEAKLDLQNSACGLCCRPLTLINACVDHDHGNGRIRALLCKGCNTGLGLFGDDPARLRAAAEYIEAFRKSLDAPLPVP